MLQRFKRLFGNEYQELKALRVQVQEMASIVDWESIKRGRGLDDTSGDTGNDYTGYEQATKELAKKYDGSGEWGNQIAQILIDARATAAVGSGLNVTVPKENEKEKEFIDRFIEHNDLDEENVITFATDGEIDGKMLIQLVMEKAVDDKPVVGVRMIPWSETGYEVETDPKDYKKVVKVEYKVKDTTVTLKNPDEFVFFKLAGRTTKVNETRSKVAKVLMEMENLDRALKDLRKVNKLFARPTPWAETDTIEEAQTLVDYVEGKKWKLGMFMAGTAKFSFVTADMEGAVSLLKEIVICVQIISGGTGIPPHFLGFPELMSNRATAESLMEMVVLATSKERKAQIGGWDEVIKKAMVMENKVQGNTALDPSVIKVDIPYTSNEALQEVVDAWMPLREGGHISEDTFLSKIPGINPEEEKEALEEEESGNVDKFEEHKKRVTKEIGDQLAEARKRKALEAADAEGVI